MHRVVPVLWTALLLPASAEVSPYAGAIGGIATLSADAGSQATAQGLAISAYSPANGPAWNIFAGAHLHNHFSIQTNYIRNSNDVVMSSTSSAADTFYEQARTTSQHAFIFDLLLYFRGRESRIRPYLGTGGGVAYLSSTAVRVLRAGSAAPLPPPEFSSTRPIFRSHVGIDVRLHRRVDFRYSFSETIRSNAISRHLSPAAPRRLANFQNLFGFVFCF